MKITRLADLADPAMCRRLVVKVGSSLLVGGEGVRRHWLEGLVAELAAMFDRQTAPEQAFELSLENGRLHWNIVEDGRPGRERAEPEAGLARRIGAWLIGRVPHDYF